MRYHAWLEDEQLSLPQPRPVTDTFKVSFKGNIIDTGIGIHDSSSSLVPYMRVSGEPFILVSTGTWCISMNPFNHEPLTGDQLKQDCLCYMSIERQMVKSSRFFLGRIHDLNVERLETYYGADRHSFRKLAPDPRELQSLRAGGKTVRHFFREGVPEGLTDLDADLSVFSSFREAYARFICDLTTLAVQSVGLVIARDDMTKILFITGGFARNPFFTGLMALAFPGKKVYTSEIANATSLGAAQVISAKVWPGPAVKPV